MEAPTSKTASNTGLATNASHVTATVSLPDVPETSSRTLRNTKVFEVNSKEMFENIISAAGNKIILVEFFATWCGPCKLIGAKLEELAEQYNERAVVIKIDVDDFEDIANEYDVVSMPTLVFLQNKQKIDLIVGSNMEKVEKNLEKYCSK